MGNWRPFEDYTPFAQTLVQFMWEQRPPLLPAQFATKVGISRQTMARILNQDTFPEPSALLRMARLLGVPSQRLFELAGYTTAQDPIFSQEEGWEAVIHVVATTPTITEQQRHACLSILRSLHPASPDAPPPEGVTLPLPTALPHLIGEGSSSGPAD